MGKRFLLQRLVQGTPVGLSNFSHEKYSHCEVSWVSEGQKEWVRSMISKGQGWINPTANCLSFGTSILCIPHFWNWSCLTKNSKFASWKIQSCLTKISKLSHENIEVVSQNLMLSHEFWIVSRKNVSNAQHAKASNHQNHVRRSDGRPHVYLLWISLPC